MMPDQNDRLAGMVYASLAADALALGAHWIYDQNELKEKLGRVTDFRKPLPDSYHPSKQAGEQTHYGDQTLALLESLTAKRGYDEADFSTRWQKSWDGYPDYFDHATRDTLANLKKGVPSVDAGSASEELGGAARIAPLLAALHGQPLDAQIGSAISQTRLTHASPIALDAATFLTRTVAGIFEERPIDVAVQRAGATPYDALPVWEIMESVLETSSLNTGAAAEKLGLACPADQAIPTVLMLLLRHPDDLETALIENVMIGGDSAARGLALGLILGARHGRQAIPERWIEGLKGRPRVEAFLETL